MAGMILSSSSLNKAFLRGRRLFRFSLRTMLLLTTALCIWLGFAFNRAQVQQRADEAIRAVQGRVVYDWQVASEANTSGIAPVPPGPQWLRKLIGRHYFDEIVEVHLSMYAGIDARKTIVNAGPHLPRLPGLRSLNLGSLELTQTEYRMIAGLKQLRKLRLFNIEINDCDAEELSQATSLRELSLDECIISTNGLREFAKLAFLEKFSLSCKYHFPNAKVTVTDEYKLRDDGTEAIAGFPRLRSLSLYQTLITDQGVAALCQLANLEHLTVSSPLVTNTALKQVFKMCKLQYLGAWQWQLHDEDLIAFQKLPTLRSLDLLSVPLSNECLHDVAKLHRLESLRLDGDRITDAGLHHLHDMSNLTWLDLSGTGIERNGLAIKLLRQELPKCKVAQPKIPQQNPDWSVQ